MAPIKTDPSQTKVVVVLIVVLLSAVGVTAFRLKPSAPPAPAGTTADQQPPQATKTQVSSVVCEVSRNPFVRPDALVDAVRDAECDAEETVGSMLTARATRPWTPRDVPIAEVHPIPPAFPFAFPTVSSGAPKQVEHQQKARPRFALLATVKDGEGYSAVIQTDGSEIRVVEIGDVLDRGYRVKALSQTKAVLSDGSDIVIATRPHS